MRAIRRGAAGTAAARRGPRPFQADPVHVGPAWGLPSPGRFPELRDEPAHHRPAARVHDEGAEATSREAAPGDATLPRGDPERMVEHEGGVLPAARSDQDVSRLGEPRPQRCADLVEGPGDDDDVGVQTEALCGRAQTGDTGSGDHDVWHGRRDVQGGQDLRHPGAGRDVVRQPAAAVVSSVTAGRPRRDRSSSPQPSQRDGGRGQGRVVATDPVDACDGMDRARPAGRSARRARPRRAAAPSAPRPRRRHACPGP